MKMSGRASLIPGEVKESGCGHAPDTRYWGCDWGEDFSHGLRDDAAGCVPDSEENHGQGNVPGYVRNCRSGELDCDSGWNLPRS